MAPHDALEIKMEPADEEAPQQPEAGIYILHFSRLPWDHTSHFECMSKEKEGEKKVEEGSIIRPRNFLCTEYIVKIGQGLLVIKYRVPTHIYFLLNSLKTLYLR